MKKLSKKAAIEMSMGTVVVIVLSVTILIFGMIFIKNIMCAGIIMTNGINEKVTNEIQSMFETSDYGVKCMGENGQEVSLGDGGSRQVYCVISTDTNANYNLNVMTIESISNTGESDATVRSWVIDEGWTGSVTPDGATPTILVLDIPRDVAATKLKITVKETIGASAPKTHTLYVNVKHVGQVAATIC